MVKRYGVDTMLEAAARPDPMRAAATGALAIIGRNPVHATALIPQEPPALSQGAGSRLTEAGPRVPTPERWAFLPSAVASPLLAADPGRHTICVAAHVAPQSRYLAPPSPAGFLLPKWAKRALQLTAVNDRPVTSVYGGVGTANLNPPPTRRFRAHTDLAPH